MDHHNWKVVVPAKIPPDKRKKCYLTHTDLQILSRASTFLYNKANLMYIRYRVPDPHSLDKAANTYTVRYFTADYIKRYNRTTIWSGGKLTPITEATSWDHVPWKPPY